MDIIIKLAPANHVWARIIQQGHIPLGHKASESITIARRAVGFRLIPLLGGIERKYTFHSVCSVSSSDHESCMAGSKGSEREIKKDIKTLTKAYAERYLKYYQITLK
jgi:hypothetical protein